MPSQYDGREPFFRYLDSAGNGLGTKNMATTADIYYLEAGANETINLHRMLVTYQDAGGGTVSEYGNISALTTGIEIKLVNDQGDTLIDLTDGVPIQQNGHWARTCYDHQRISYGSGEDLWATRWTFDKAGRPILMQPGDRFEFQVNDNLTNLSNHYAMVQGYVLRG